MKDVETSEVVYICLNCHNKKIKSVFVKTKVLKKVGKAAFKNINKKVSFRVPASKKTAYRKFW